MPSVSLPTQLAISPQALAEFCQRHGIRRLLLFGSATTNTLTPTSDIDLLAEFEPTAITGFRIVHMQTELSDLFGRPVDLTTPAALSPRLRDKILRQAQVLYE